MPSTHRHGTCGVCSTRPQSIRRIYAVRPIISNSNVFFTIFANAFTNGLILATFTCIIFGFVTVARSDNTYGGNDQAEDDRTVLGSLAEEDEELAAIAVPENYPGEQITFGKLSSV